MRQSWDEYFLSIAEKVASRSTCPRSSSGAIIVKDKRIISTGYNGSPPGHPHCTEAGCLVVSNHCLRAIHAEINAIAQAAKFGISVDGTTLYHWVDSKRYRVPCVKCLQVIKAAGITKLISIRGHESLEWSDKNLRRRV